MGIGLQLIYKLTSVFWLYVDHIFHTKNTEHDADETQKIILIIPETCFLLIVNAVAV